MSIPFSPNFLKLEGTPHSVAVLHHVKQFPIWIGRFASESSDATEFLVLEPSFSFPNDVFVVDGERNVSLIRDGHKWPVRFLNATFRVEYMSNFSPDQYASVRRVRQAQYCLQNGQLKLIALVEDARSYPIPRYKTGKPLLWDPARFTSYQRQGDLLRSCDYSEEFRLISPYSALLRAESLAA